jgi:hypothetical protein
MSQTIDLRPMRVLVWPCYLMAAFLITMPLLEAVSAIASFRPGEAQWRFGSTGIMTTALLTPPIGVFVALVTARLFGHRWVHGVLIGFAVLTMVLLMVMMPTFVFDTLQLRNEVRPQFYRSFHLAAGKVFANQLAVFVIMLAFAIASFRSMRASKGPAPAAARAASEPAAPLLSRMAR